MIEREREGEGEEKLPHIVHLLLRECVQVPMSESVWEDGESGKVHKTISLELFINALLSFEA